MIQIIKFQASRATVLVNCLQTACVAGFIASVNVAAAAGADLLLEVDQNRHAIIDRIVDGWKKEPLSPTERAQLRTRLESLRADQLAGVGLTGSLDHALGTLVANERLLSQAEGSSLGGIDKSKALGELNRDLVYTPVAPCRLFDTRAGQASALGTVGGAFPNQTQRTITPAGACGIPTSDVASVMVSFHAVTTNPPVLGIVSFMAPGAGLTAMAATWTGGDWVTGTFIAPTNSAGQFDVFVGNPAPMSAHFVVDVVGYFMPPNRGGNGLRVIQTTGAYPNAPITINGSSSNIANAQGAAVVSGGYSGSNCTNPLTAATDYGCENQATGVFSTVGGGFSNRATAFSSTVMGGQTNTATGSSASIFGGQKNTAAGSNSVIVGGLLNKTSAAGLRSVVVGGQKNEANADSAFAGGTFALAAHDGAFVWADFDQVNQFSSSVANEFAVRAKGGVRFVSATNPTGTPTAGVSLAAGGGSFTSLSDRNAKTAIQSIKPTDILSKVLALPISTWQYKSQDKSIRHVGPMSQDFKKAFGVGETETGISTVDADGVALAAIQGLNQKLVTALKVKDAEVAKLNAELSAIKKKLGL